MAPSTPREFYNAGTKKLREGKLREAEAYLETALSSQSERVQPPTLYNLGHVRFTQGIEELKKGPEAKETVARSRSTAQRGDDAIRSTEEALSGNDPVQNLVAAYLRGRGARKELKAAISAVKRAMETYNVALNKWQRASGDFRSAAELDPANADARKNAEAVDKRIAKLVDSLKELQQMATMLGDKNKELGEKLKQLKGRIPAPDMPPGAAGDDEDEEEEEQPSGLQPDQKEGPSKEGQEQEIPISPELAGWLLDGFKLGNDRRLPMGQNDTAEPKNRSRQTW